MYRIVARGTDRELGRTDSLLEAWRALRDCRDAGVLADVRKAAA